MTNEEIVKELIYIRDMVGSELGHGNVITVAVKNFIEKLSPKPLFKVGPAKLRNGWDAEIYKIFDDCIHGYYLPETGEKLLYCWGINGLLRYNSTTKLDIDLLPNNEPGKK